jgi:cellulose biosynthesis protein BcsQ
MSLLAIAAGKGSPGVTTTAMALAAVWPRPAILADCDPAGGDVALRLRRPDGRFLARDRGVVGLAAAARVGRGHLDVEGQLQQVVGGLSVLVGADSASQAQAIGALWPAVAQALAEAPEDVVADCGRIMPGASTDHVLRRADLVLLVTRSSPEAVAHLRHAFDHLNDLCGVGSDGDRVPDIGVVVIGDAHRQPLREVRRALALSGSVDCVLGRLAFDAAAAEGLAGMPTRGLDRSALVTTARELAGLADQQLAQRSMAGWVPEPVVDTADLNAAVRGG